MFLTASWCRSPPRGRRRPQPKATRPIADMLRAAPPHPTPRPATRGRAPLTPWQSAFSAFATAIHTAAAAAAWQGEHKRDLGPLWHVPPGCRAGIGKGPLGEERLNSTRLTSPPLDLCQKGVTQHRVREGGVNNRLIIEAMYV